MKDWQTELLIKYDNHPPESDLKKIKEGKSLRILYQSNYYDIKATITHILPSSLDEDIILIVFKYYDHSRKYWIEAMLNDYEFCRCIDKYNKLKAGIE